MYQPPSNNDENMEKKNKKAMPQKDEEISVQVIGDQLQGTVLKERFQIGKRLGKGSNCQVHKVVDLHDEHRPLVIKFGPDLHLLMKEVKAIQVVNEKIDESTHKPCSSLP